MLAQTSVVGYFNFGGSDVTRLIVNRFDCLSYLILLAHARLLNVRVFRVRGVHTAQIRQTGKF